MIKKKQGKIIIIAGPAGVGKDTIIKGALKKLSDPTSPRLRGASFVTVKSYATRPKRGSDEAGNRIFVSDGQFKKMIKNKEFVEWARVHSWHYGRRRDDIVRHIEKGKNVIIEVDVVGTLQYKKKFPDCLAFFIKFENIAQFEKRLKQTRPEITEEELEIRRQSMKKEMKYEKYYDHSIINPEGNPEKAIQEVEKIIRSVIQST